MPERIYWNKWGLIPAFVFTVSTALLLLWMMEKQSVWPLHFNESGTLTRSGDIRELWMVCGIQAWAILLMGVLDEGFMKTRRRVFNFSGALATFICGILFCIVAATAVVGQWDEPHLPEGFSFLLYGVPLLAALLAYGLEFIRRYPSGEEQESVFTIPDIEGGQWVYWESTHARWFGLCIAIAIVPAAVLVCLSSVTLGVKVAMAGLTALMLIFPGGLSLELTPRQFNVRLGYLRIPVLWVKVENIVGVERVAFDPIARFGGWGLRYGVNSGWGIILSGRGIEILTRKNRRITVSSKHPEVLVGLFSRLLADRQHQKAGT